MDNVCLALRNDLVTRLSAHPDPQAVLLDPWFQLALNRLDPEAPQYVGGLGKSRWLDAAAFSYQKGLDVLDDLMEPAPF